MRLRPLLLHASLSLLTLAAATVLLRSAADTSPTTVALTYLLVVLFAASLSSLPVAVVTALVAMLWLNYFFMPPVGTFTIADAHNWVALGAFLVVAVVASHLSTTARTRAVEAVERKNELTRLFDLSRDVLLTTDGKGATAAVARHVARRFELPIVTIAEAEDAGGWRVVQGGSDVPSLTSTDYDRAWAHATGALEFDARTRSYGGHRTVALEDHTIALVPVRVGVRPVGLVALGGRALDPGTADAIAGVIAIAIERARFLEEQHAAELARHRADLTSVLLAALGHDLRTPLTAIRVAVTNTADLEMDPALRAEQARLALDQIDHLGRLLQEILDLARIEARAVHAERAWVTAGAVVEAAAAHVGPALARHRLRVEADEASELQLDPRLTSAALAHVLENAAKYSPLGTTISVDATATPEGLRVTVGDEGPGLKTDDLERLFEPFYRGRSDRSVGGTGLGLAITRGLLAAEGGRIWADAPGGPGARFTIVVPASVRPVDPQGAWT